MNSTTIKLETSHTYKSVAISNNINNILEYLNSLDEQSGEKILRKLDENIESPFVLIPFKKEDITGILIKNESLKEDERMSIYIFEKKKDIIEMFTEYPILKDQSSIFEAIEKV